MTSKKEILEKFECKNGRLNSMHLKYIDKYLSKEDEDYLYTLYPNDFPNKVDYIRCLKFDIKERPRCPICGNYTNWAYQSYHVHCSVKCSKLDENVQAKMESTCMNKYGVRNGGGSKEALEKIRRTSIEHYGVDNPYKAKEVKEKIRNTCISKYGVDCISKSKSWKENMSKIMQSKEMRKRIYDTKKRNHTFNSSKVEDKLYIDLCSIYGEDNIIRNYNNDLYPWNCDFYIAPLDLYIELQGYYTHGQHPYDENNIEDQNRKKYLIDKYGEDNQQVRIWTISDVKKRYKAKENSLKYLEIYDYNSLRINDIKKLVNLTNHHKHVIFMNKKCEYRIKF